MIVYIYSEARQKSAKLLDQVLEEGEVRIKRKDGQIFVIKPEPRRGSPFDLPGLELGAPAPEIAKFIHKGRRFSTG